MGVKEKLTTELLKKRFSDRGAFDLVNYAIDVARNMVLTGRETTVSTDVMNQAYQVLEEIASNREHFAEMPEPEDELPELKAPTKESIAQAAKAPKEEVSSDEEEDKEAPEEEEELAAQ